jgi:hypothetical protein
MRRNRTLVQALIGATIVAGGTIALAPTASAITIPVACSQNALVAAVNQANATPAADTLVLAGGCTYNMTSPHGSPANGDEALPVITTPIEMIGPATIRRSSLLGLVRFRIIEVSSSGNLTLTTSVDLTNGSAVGDGGGILNFGAVTLTNSSLTSNRASGNGGGLANAGTASGTAPAATFTRSPLSSNIAGSNGGAIYNGSRATLTTTGVSGSPLFIRGNTAALRGGGIAAVDSNPVPVTTTTLTQTSVTGNHAGPTAGGVYRQGGTMTTTNSPITANTPNNCVGSVPAVPNCTG